MGRKKIKMDNSFNIDYKAVAQAYCEFQYEYQEYEANEKINEYLVHLAEYGDDYVEELNRRLNTESDFKSQMMYSVLHLSVLITASLVDGDDGMYDEALKIVKEKSKEDYKETRDFKIYLLENFSIHDLEKEIGYPFSKELMDSYAKKYIEMYNFFTNGEQ